MSSDSGEDSDDSALDLVPLPQRRRLRGKESFCLELDPFIATEAERIRKCGLPPRPYFLLKSLGWPAQCFACLAFLTATFGPPKLDLWCIEFFSGCGQVHSHFTNAGFAAVGYDIINPDGSVYQDLTTPEGFLTAMRWITRLHHRGLTHWATKCSTWVWISRSSTKRSKDDPWGGESAEVQSANCMVCRMILLIMLSVALHGQWIVEQPRSSLMPVVPPFQCLLPYELYFTWMGAYGAGSRKPTMLVSASKWVQNLHRSLPASFEASVQTSTKNAGGAVTGNRDELHATQAYPPDYGKAVQEEWRRGFYETNTPVLEPLPGGIPDVERAKLDEVAARFDIPPDIDEVAARFAIPSGI